MTVLDVCAAPGNKTAQMLAAGGKVVACDRSLARLAEVPAEAAMRVVLDGAYAASLRCEVRSDSGGRTLLRDRNAQ